MVIVGALTFAVILGKISSLIDSLDKTGARPQRFVAEHTDETALAMHPANVLCATGQRGVTPKVIVGFVDRRDQVLALRRRCLFLRSEINH